MKYTVQRLSRLPLIAIIHVAKKINFETQGNVLMSIYIDKVLCKEKNIHMSNLSPPHLSSSIRFITQHPYISAYKKLPSWSTYSIVCFVTQYPCSSHGSVGYGNTPELG